MLYLNCQLLEVWDVAKPPSNQLCSWIVALGCWNCLLCWEDSANAIRSYLYSKVAAFGLYVCELPTRCVAGRGLLVPCCNTPAMYTEKT
jgi:hypothetical protein